MNLFINNQIKFRSKASEQRRELIIRNRARQRQPNQAQLRAAQPQQEVGNTRQSLIPQPIFQRFQGNVLLMGQSKIFVCYDFYFI